MSENREINSKINGIENIMKKFTKKLYIDVIFEFVKNHKLVGIPILSIVIPIILHFLYGVGYMFLYGFYFGGTADKSPSLLEMFVFPIPFDFHSVVIVSIIFLIGILLLTTLTNETLQFIKVFNKPNNLKEIIRNNTKNIGIVAVAFIAYHASLSIVFLNIGGDFEKISLFLGVWVGPFTLAILVVWLWGFREKSVLNIIEVFFSIIFITIIGLILNSILKASGINMSLLNYKESFDRLNIDYTYI
ncbi:hypothetical protein [Aneurinibacillus migulanus]|uniref:hypothetical protein n=1 Tax=Aneurinibacillus migulanus TaxID=47500 RepID=UPI0006B69A09|nr:hypothetical protein [Aneurinibacillus migulanus]